MITSGVVNGWSVVTGSWIWGLDLRDFGYIELKPVDYAIEAGYCGA